MTNRQILPGPTRYGAAATAVVMLMLVATSGADAAGTGYVCEQPVDETDATEARLDYADHYECVDAVVDDWLDDHPAELERLADQYRIWQHSRDADLRDRREANDFTDDHRPDFPTRDVRLGPDEAAEMAPPADAPPVQVGGRFQRFFVDRDAGRLFLTTDDEGLAPVDITRRYAFEREESQALDDGEDFFVVDDETALVEEAGADDHARDLVVLDISDPAGPREIHRLPAVLPTISEADESRAPIPDRPPTFGEYRAIREGYFHIPSCGRPPTVSTASNIHCRPDGSCYDRVRTARPQQGIQCDRQMIHPGRRHTSVELREIRAARTTGRPARSPTPLFGAGEADSASSSTIDLDGRTTASASPSTSERDSRPRPEPEPTDAPSDTPVDDGPEGGEGGAGSLSQMMVVDSTLFVLTGAQHRDDGWLTVFDLTDPRRPEMTDVIGLDNAPEALNRHGDLLLIAGRKALTVASVAGDDGLRLLGEHRQNCPVVFDPVVAEGPVAYRTVIFDDPRNRCSSRLEVIDLTEPHAPRMRATREIDRPRGLAMLDDRLFVADESNGVRVYEMTDPLSPTWIATWGLPGVEDLVLSDFDLYAMAPDEISTFYVGSLFEEGNDPAEAATDIDGHTTVVRDDR